MNKFVTSCLTANLMACLLALLAACSAQPNQPPFAEAPLFGARIGGDFSLTDQNGKVRTYAEFDGKYRLIYFGYTSCPDICTPDMHNLMAGLKQFEKDAPELAAKVQPIFITVDPERDTPPILKQFTSSFHPKLVGLTGSEADIAAAAKKFAVYYNKIPNSGLFTHTQTPYLMDPQGKPLAVLPINEPATPANEASPGLVAAELAKWVR